MPLRLALLATLVLGACGNTTPTAPGNGSSLPRGTALAPPGVDMPLPPPVGPDRR